MGACTGWNPATGLVGANLGGYAIDAGRVAMTVGADGFYQFLFTPTAPASCTFGLTVTPPSGHIFQSAVIPPTAGPLVPAGGAGSVSYTHLDVYKRQPTPSVMALRVLGAVAGDVAVPPLLPGTVAPLTVPAGCTGSRRV